MDKRNKLGQYTKFNKPSNPFPKGNTPWNLMPLIHFRCLYCKKEEDLNFRFKHKKFCNQSCKGKFYGKKCAKNFKHKTENLLYKGNEKQYKQQWYLERRDEILLKNKERYQENKEQYKEMNKKWQINNKEKVSFIKQQYKFRKRTAIGKFSYEEWIELKKKNDYTCLECKRKEPEIKLEADHIVPLSKNGTNEITNIQPLCRSCNASKGNRIKVKI